MEAKKVRVKENKKSLRYKTATYNELRLIAAEVNAKGVGTFIDDFFLAWAVAFKTEDISIVFDPVMFASDEEAMLTTTDIKPSTLYELRILAVRLNMSLKHYIESVCEWLANEHRVNGRYWFDDTQKRALPIRTRAF